MIKQTIETAVAAAAAKKTTNWAVFDKAQLVPTEITCLAYREFHPHDGACHTRLPIDGDVVLNHVQGQCGGGFQFRLKESPRPWSGWKKFAEAGLELLDFRCEVCNDRLPLNVARIREPHMKPHSGKFRRVFPDFHSVFNLTLGYRQPVPTDEEAYEAEAT